MLATGVESERLAVTSKGAVYFTEHDREAASGYMIPASGEQAARW